MKVALIQAPLIWENPQANRKSFEEKINALQQEIDLIVLPEMFTTGFTMNPKDVAESMEGETISKLKDWARNKNAAITGSLIIAEKENFYNRLVFVSPSGEIQYYDKRHLFSLAGEEKVYISGKSRLVVDYKGWKICPLICYDLRFPVFSRNTEDYDLLLYVANWPKPRANAWDILLKARSVENMCYTIGVNRVGFDESGHEYIGHSQAIDFLGNTVSNAEVFEGIFIADLDKNAMLEARQKFGFLNDRDSFEIL